MPDASVPQKAPLFSEPYVSWRVFTWTVVIVTGLLGGVTMWMRAIQSRVDNALDAQQAISIQLSQIQADLKNIDARLTELRVDLKDAVRR